MMYLREVIYDHCLSLLNKSALPPKAITQGIDEQILKNEYFEKGLAGLPDDFVLYRIIGNDLYPRHNKGQSRDNLLFILANEPELDKCQKRWIVNRIVDPKEEEKIIAALEKHQQQYIRIPFDSNAYKCLGWAMETFPSANYLRSKKFKKLSPELQMRAIVQTYRHKNNYVMNNNGARNAALAEGRKTAKWVLPWDGNCFLTNAAWTAIVNKITNKPHFKYFIVPMTRVQDNRDLLTPDFRPEPTQEPQIVFRCDAGETFNEAWPYGRRPKVEMLWRLGVPGPWENWKKEPWDLPFPKHSPEAGQFAFAGWVARLFSGKAEMEENNQDSFFKRGPARIEAIINTLDEIDRQLMNTEPDRHD